jgi:hypothetical protein
MVIGHLKEFKVCPQCKTARYCGDACQKLDWHSGGHKATCGTFICKGRKAKTLVTYEAETVKNRPTRGHGQS